MSAVEFRNVHKVFAGRQGHVVALAGLTFSLQEGEYVTIVGRTGCGKSTAVNILLGLMAPTSGEVRVLGFDPSQQFDRLRGRIGAIFQTDRLLPWRTALENVRLPMEILGLQESPSGYSPHQWLERLGLKGFEGAYPHELSGGMRQRVAIARAMVTGPQVVLADEAFGHLDEVTGGQLRRDFKSLVELTGQGVLHISHSIDEAITMSDRVIVMGKPGRVIAEVPIPANVTAEERTRLRQRIFESIAQSDALPEERPAAARADTLPHG